MRSGIVRLNLTFGWRGWIGFRPIVTGNIVLQDLSIWMSSAAKIARGGTCFFVSVGFSFMATQAIAGPDGCDIDGDVAICTGDQGDGVIAGVDFPSSVVFLKVKPDEGPIAPGAGTPGIYDVFDTTLWLKSRADIFATDADAIAIEGPGTLWLDSRGDLDRKSVV